ncbi:MAG: pyridoxamine 5'-phosphate oxidase family protein [bacterium]|nr:pyridoxamine 5'-phosphate oxidase family protein [bacterium]
MASPFHAGERAVQDRAGVRHMADKVGNGIRPAFPAGAAEALAELRLAIVAAADLEGRLWASPLSGPPGFLDVGPDGLLHVATTVAPDDPLAARLAHGGPVGLVVFDPANRRRLRVNGDAMPASGGLRVRPRQVYGNCPRYIQRRVPLHDATGADAVPGPVAAGATLTPEQAARLARTDTFFVATLHADAGPDASHRGGTPGFVRVRADGGALAWPDYAGNAMFQTLGNLAVDPRAGLLVLDFERGDVLQLSGTARADWDAARADTVPGAERMVDFDVAAVRERAAAVPLRWRRLDASPHNPPAA